MTDALPLLQAISRRLDALLAERRERLRPLGPDLDALFDQLASFTEPGKRLRAQFIAAGAHAAGPSDALVDLATAVELFHAAALVHDDLIDRSDLRRGLPATHRVFETHHQSAGWAGDATHFGTSAAILAGDLLLMWCDDLLADALSTLPIERARAVRTEFSRMREEVTAGQYLDLVEELAWPVVPLADRRERAITVAITKSARYSVETPLVLGALLAGRPAEEIEYIRRFGVPLGLAFQLRDDLLGVFGDSAQTGKPAGDDLREGKRTLLIAETEARLSDVDRERFRQRLGAADLAAVEIAELQALIRSSGALDAVNARIDTELTTAREALAAADLDAEATANLLHLADRAANRSA